MAAKFQYSFRKGKEETEESDTVTETEDEQPKHESVPMYTQPYTTAGRRLEPLEGRETDVKFAHPHSKYRKKISPTKGGQPEKSDEHIISLPEAAGSLPAQSKHGILSMPGDSIDSPRFALKASQEALETVIYFEDKTGIILRVEDGQNADAGELFEMVMEEMRFPEVARQAFSLWLVSDNLELQLKPSHVPFKLAAYWEELLEKYTSTCAEDAERDEPVLIFRKNVFFPRNDEAMIQSPELIKLLFHEQKEMVVDGRYPLTLSQTVYLAGLQALCDHTGHNPHDHTPEYYREKLAEYLPKHFAKRSLWNRVFKKEENPEYKIADAHARAYSQYGVPNTQEKLTNIYKVYLQFLRRLPYYGAAFFRGQIEQPGKPILFDKMDNPVFVAVNTEGVFIIDMDDDVFLFGLLYRNMAWNYAEPRDSNNKSCMPCIFFQFTDKLADGTQQKGITQVFTKQAKLIDLLMLSCLELMRDRENRGQELVKIEDLDKDGVIEGADDVWANTKRLCIAHFDEKKGRFTDDSNIKRINKLKRQSTK